MTIRKILVLAAVAAGTIVVASPALAKDEACTDGTTCLCDKIKQTDPAVVFCEDFESPVLDQNGSGGGWTDAYGAPGTAAGRRVCLAVSG